MDIDMKLTQLHAKGVLITSDVKSQVKIDVKQKSTEYHDKVNQLGIPDKLKDFFLIKRKRDAEHCSRDIVVSEYDLFLLIHNCSQVHFTHRSKFRQHIPAHLRVSQTDREQMKLGSPKKFLTKTRSGLLERRYIHVHLFECGSDWHCFYFSHQDIEPSGANHWRYGCHLHYVSHLWPKLRKKWVWNQFNKRFTEISGSLHIRFEPFEFPHPDEAKESNLINGSTLPPWAVAFDPNLACGCGAIALPVAQVATRGLWVIKVSPPYKSNQ
ncbi:MAG: hypothetical protein FJ023_01050 [Chloroflexi bacterium]|nr:hypothetical protein [Chloroflexota bacterium]